MGNFFTISYHLSLFPPLPTPIPPLSNVFWSASYYLWGLFLSLLICFLKYEETRSNFSQTLQEISDGKPETLKQSLLLTLQNSCKSIRSICIVGMGRLWDRLTSLGYVILKQVKNEVIYHEKGKRRNCGPEVLLFTIPILPKFYIAQIFTRARFFRIAILLNKFSRPFHSSVF